MLLGVLAVAIAATFLGVFLTSGDEEEAGAETPAASATPIPGTDLTVTMDDNFFTYQGQRNPSIPVQANRDWTIGLPNEGTIIHNMRIAGPDNRYDNSDDFASDPLSIRANQSGIIRFRFSSSGTFNFRCDFHPTEMVGTLMVQ
jgi:hypothetical protein